VYTSGCATVVRVNQGGQLTVGVSPAYTAALQISRNDLLDLRSGRQVTVAAGSVLHIVRGGTLVLRGGTTLALNGQLLVDDGAFICVEDPTAS
jgi:hypothetical protein